MASCFGASSSVTYTLPIIFDLMGSSTPFFGSLQWVSTQINCSCASVYGKVLDGNSPLAFAQIYNPLPGAAVCVNACASTVNQNQQTVTNAQGYFALANVPLTTGGTQTVTLYMQLSGYNPLITQPLVSPSSVPVNVGTFVMQPSAAGQQCIIPPIPNPVPGGSPLFGGLCLPNWEIALIFIGSFGLLGFTIFLAVPSKRKFGVAFKDLKLGV
jgi:hypothetical protein